MAKLNTQPARLHALIARQTRRAVVFRRGPVKQTLILVWNLADDTLEAGQWLKGRVYERRSDLSPDGELLVYEAADNRPPLYSWTAVSRPPYLTALALWANMGMWGGGMFGDDWRTLLLNNLSRGDVPQTPTGKAIPEALRVAPLAPKADELSMVFQGLRRDGWTIVGEGVPRRLKRDSAVRIQLDPPAIREKRIGASGFKLNVQLHETSDSKGPPYVETGQIQDQDERVVIRLGWIDWADVDITGDVLYAAGGCLYRLPLERTGPGAADLSPIKVADLNGLTFQPKATPEWPRAWP